MAQLLILLCFFIPSTFSKQVSIFHTNDLHSYFNGTLIRGKNGNIERRGGYGRLATLLDSKRVASREKNHFVITTDSGDFYSGSLFHAIAMRANMPLFPEYAFFNAQEYDAITLGNHEFDGRDDGFSLLMRKVLMLGNIVPIVSTNFRGSKKESKVILKKLLKKIKNRSGEILNVGFLGALGPDGCDVSLGNRTLNKFVGYDDKSRSTQWNKLIALLNKNAKILRDEGAEIIILLLHGGGEEDAYLAKRIDEIDVILAGHTHEKYFKVINDTLVSQAGSYGAYLGQVSFDLEGEKISSVTVKHHEINQDIKSKEDTSKSIDLYERHIKRILNNKGIFSQFSNSQVTRNFKNNYLKGAVPSLGGFVTTNVFNQVKEEVKDLSFYFTAKGLIRNEIYKGYDYDPIEMFNILPIGFNKGFDLGLKVVSFYLNKSEVENLIDFLDLYGFFKSKAVPSFSESLTFEKNKWGIPFINRIKNLKIKGGAPKGLIRVATNTFLYSYIDLIAKKTFGLISLVPKNKSGESLPRPYYHGVEVEYFLKGVFSKNSSPTL